MGLINNPNKLKDPLNRGHEIKPEEKFTIEDLEKIKDEKSEDVNNITFYSNVRINNHIKNKLEAIAITGNSKSQKDSIEKALNYYIESFSDREKEAIQAVVRTLELRDVKQKGKK
ncbi:DUF5388 domain-containing protein [Lentilactobacillus hilgardii]|uniref:DUF5388 domain-containing protein n=1 Tax=Lentilactobacillus hilgardii TaxID=1588 RepID=UPI00019C6046|nr:DUF5388 domain-containing protein [Lentilactobacillus hilgardii]EEI18287.1 hypothetical protein HMPREF0497_2922 [Lentilactobacillus buchneri ATCC 11577]MCT3397520.1 hypothetical protein [Lentilactobacillus hilgardii]MCT3399255.1 hypothetical protein [Lentilactobacillus hilgardii]